MPKKTTKPKKREKTNWFDSFIDKMFIWIWELKSGHIAFFSWAIFLLWIIFQSALIGNFLWENSSYFAFMTLDNTLLFSLLFFFVFIIWAMFPPVLIFYIIGVILFDNAEYQKYTVLVWIIISLVLFYFNWYRNVFLKHLKIFWIIYFILFIFWSFIMYKKVLNSQTTMIITTSEKSFQAKLYFSNWAYYFIKKDKEKIILNSRDVKSIKIIETWDYEINICNNTDIVFNEVSLHAWLNYEEIKPWDCSEYKERKELYRYVPITIFTEEDWIDTRYSIFPTDYVWEELYPNWKYTININGLLKENKAIEYNNWIDFEIK